ncbi:hypothetical protein ACFXKJ_10925 [Kitasatospora indigofera]|uniref:hypothetical protein n=1 Tax=Kitasatospora indigofera TaxID=67307 RepID=UPI0036738755
MNITVTSVRGDGSGHVEFSSEFGDAFGLWQGGGPAALGRYDVEIDLPETLESWKPSDGGRSLRMVRGSDGVERVQLSGSVEQIGEDGVVALKIGRDIVLAEFVDSCELPIAGATVALCPVILELYPYDL